MTAHARTLVLSLAITAMSIARSKRAPDQHELTRTLLVTGAFEGGQYTLSRFFSQQAQPADLRLFEVSHRCFAGDHRDRHDRQGADDGRHFRS